MLDPIPRINFFLLYCQRNNRRISKEFYLKERPDLSRYCSYIKDAGFVYESFRNKTNRVIWNFWSYEKNPQNESLGNRPTKRIHKTNLWKTGLQNESTIQIFKVWIRESGIANLPAWIRKDSFRAIVLRIHQDSWGFVGFMKTGRIFGCSGHETNPRFESLRIGLTNPDSRICEVRFVNHETKQIFLESGFVTTIRNESMDLQNESTFLRISYTIPASLSYIHYILNQYPRFYFHQY